jgi:MSHA pilin protein MshD
MFVTNPLTVFLTQSLKTQSLNRRNVLPKHLSYNFHYSNGFTLIELVIGIVVFSISLSIITGLLLPQAQRSVEPVLQVRATELAQSLLNEISAKSFDQHSDRVGGLIRCNEDLNGDGDLVDDPGEIACTAEANFGNEEANNRENYNDVDDFHGLDVSDASIVNSLGGALIVDGKNLYLGFSANITVAYTDVNQSGKLITVTVITPTGQSLSFATIRRNF